MDSGVAWPVRIVAAKHRTAEVVWKVVDTALISPGATASTRPGIERLFRDARLSRIHPANSAFTHEVVAKLTLGSIPTPSHVGANGRPRATFVIIGLPRPRQGSDPGAVGRRAQQRAEPLPTASRSTGRMSSVAM